jgi:8-hydroxy-5-deazaflavin:NADPH oxidoreductase
MRFATLRGKQERLLPGVKAVVLSIPFAKIPDLADLFKDVPDDIVGIDTSNYYPFRDGAIAEVDAGNPESIWVSEQLGRPVIKAWNAGLAETLAKKGLRAGQPGRIALPVAGDDDGAKAVAMQLVDETGFDALDAGELADSWRQHPGNPAYCTELPLDELHAALAVANKVQAAKNRDALIKEFIETNKTPTHEETVTCNRAVAALR